MAVALGIIGSVVSAVGALVSAQAQASAAEYNAAVQERNAQAAIAQGAAEAQKEKRDAVRRQGAMRAAYGASGIDMAGSALDVFTNQVAEDELARQNIRYKAKVRAIGHNDQATLDRMNAKAARTAGLIGAVSTAASGVSTTLQNAGTALKI